MSEIQFGVSLAADAPVQLARQAIASLPVSLVEVADKGDLRIVGGRGNWSDAVVRAAADGARGILVHRPATEDRDRLERAMEATRTAGCTVVLDLPFAHPALADALGAWKAPIGIDAQIVECFITGRAPTSLSDAVVAQLHLMTATAGPLDLLRADHVCADGYVLRARVAASGKLATLSAAFTQAERSALIRVVTRNDSFRLVLPDTDIAFPAEACHAGLDGKIHRAPVYEAAHRAAWRRLHHAVAENGGSDDLDRYLAALDLLAGIDLGGI